MKLDSQDPTKERPTRDDRPSTPCAPYAPGWWPGPPVPDRLAPRELARLVPDIADRDVFLCGPPPMMNAVLRTLGDLGVPKPQIHFERFSLAG